MSAKWQSPTITRRHDRDGVRSSAVYSRCGLYRYALTRVWGQGPRVAFVMLNPSTASHLRNDPTVARCESRARNMGAGAFRVVNLFAFRATLPRDLRLAEAPIGPLNDQWLRRTANWADQLICAWGNDGAYLARDAQVRTILHNSGRPVLHLGLTRSGAPRHPLYLPKDRVAEIWKIFEN